jgi:hypothetical protein
MASAPRFEGQDVVNAFNLYIDSERPNIVGDKQSRGDNVHYNFEGNTIECRDGEVMKISLVDFYMPNNFYNVEIKNSFARIRLKGSSTGIKTNDLHNYTIIERGNYYDVQDVATNFAYTLGNVIAGLDPSAGVIHKITNNSLVTQTTALVEIQVGGGGAINQGVWPLLPEQTFDGTTHYPTTNALIQTGRPDKKLLDVTIEFQHEHLLTELYISCQTANGESYLLLGGERGDNSSDTSHNSFLIDLAPTIPSDAGAGKCVRVRGYFPMQLTSEPHVYLRTTLGQNGLESAILARDDTNYNSEIIGSDILAKIPRNLDSFSYQANGNTEDFFIYYQQRKLNQIRLYLTDSKGRPIGRAGVTDAQFNFGTGTAAGLESTPPSIPPLTTDRTTFVKTTQNTQGNMYFTSTLKIQIIKKSSPQLLETPMVPFPPIPSKASGVISFGDKYGKDP